MATQTLEKARWCGGKKTIVHRTEGAGQTYKEGQFVYLHTDGTVLACADDAVTIYGMALKDATGTTSSDAPIILAEDGAFFEMNVYHATPSSAVSAQANLDEKFGLEVDSNRCYVDVGQTGADALQIFDFIDAVGDTYGRVKVVVIPAAQQLGAMGA